MHSLVLLRELFLDITHVALDLTDHRIARTALLELNHKECAPILAYRENIDWTCIGRELLTDAFAVYLENIEVTPKLGDAPILDEKIFKVLF